MLPDVAIGSVILAAVARTGIVGMVLSDDDPDLTEPEATDSEAL